LPAGGFQLVYQVLPGGLEPARAFGVVFDLAAGAASKSFEAAQDDAEAADVERFGAFSTRSILSCVPHPVHPSSDFIQPSSKNRRLPTYGGRARGEHRRGFLATWRPRSSVPRANPRRAPSLRPDILIER
jgi:hypothetical protein